MNKIEAKIQDVIFSQGIVIVDLCTIDFNLSAMMIHVQEKPLWLKKNTKVSVVFKETEVSIGKNFSGQISLRNRIPSIITEIEQGELMSVVWLKCGEFRFASAITTRSVVMMELKAGDTVTAFIKANEISLMS